MNRLSPSLFGCLLICLALAGCGGGGGGGAPADAGMPSAGLPSPAAGGTGGPVAAPASPAQAAFAAWGPVEVGGNPTSNGPAVAGLDGGGAVVVWASGDELLAQRLDAAGARIGGPLRVNDHLPSDPPGLFDVAALADGGFVVVWSAPTNFVITPGGLEYTVQSRRYSRAGESVAAGRVSQTDWHTMGSALSVAATPDGGHAVGWSAKPVRTAPLFAYLQRFAADGSPRGPEVGISPIGADQQDVSLNALPNGNIVASWVQASAGAPPQTWSLYTRPFSVDSAPLGAPWQVPTDSASAATALDHDAAALADGNVALAWQVETATGGAELRYLVTAPAGGAVGGLGRVAWDFPISGVETVAAGAGFVALWQTVRGWNRGVNVSLSSQVVAADGTALLLTPEVDLRATSTVSPTTGLASNAGTGFAASAVEGGQFVAAFFHANAPGQLPGVAALAR